METSETWIRNNTVSQILSIPGLKQCFSLHAKVITCGFLDSPWMGDGSQGNSRVS